MQASQAITGDTVREYTIERMSPAHLGDLEFLNEAVYGKPASPGYFAKKYETQYTGVSWAGLMAYNHDRVPVAYYGVIPCFIEWNGQRILTAQSADTMTHPSYRFKGMFVELSNLTFELCRQLQIRLVFGFPNQNSYHGAVHKLGWKMTDNLSAFSIPVNTLPVERMRSRFGWLKKPYDGWRNLLLDNMRLDIRGIPHSGASDGFAGVARDEAYFLYKTFSPSVVVCIEQVKLWLSFRQGLRIGDMEGVTAENFKRVINKLVSIARWMGIRDIHFHCSPGTGLHALFAEHYTASPSYPALFQDFGSPVPPEKVKFTFADIDIF